MRITLWASLSLQNKLILAMALVLLPLVVLGVGSFTLLKITNNTLSSVMSETTDSFQPVAHLQTAVLEAVNAPHHYLIYGDATERALFVDLNQEIEMAFADISAANLPANKLAIVISAEQEWQQVRILSELILGLPQPMQQPVNLEEMADYHHHLGLITDLLNQLHTLAVEEVEAAHAHAQAIAQRAVFFTTLVSLAGLGIAVWAVVLLVRAILGPLRLLQKGVASYGEGDFSYRIPLASRDELGNLARAFNDMAGKIKESQAALKELATHDGLTGLYNRREFQRLLDTEVERARRYNQPLTLLMLDIDHFKVFNDTYGHQAGDEALHTVSELTRHISRSTDYTARYGGEELAVILPQTQCDGALALAGRLRNTIASHRFNIGDGRSASITVSIGAAAFPEDAQFADGLVAAADRALYTAKAAGRNRVCT